jgi:hypothetical protein
VTNWPQDWPWEQTNPETIVVFGPGQPQSPALPGEHVDMRMELRSSHSLICHCKNCLGHIHPDMTGLAHLRAGRRDDDEVEVHVRRMKYDRYWKMDQMSWMEQIQKNRQCFQLQADGCVSVREDMHHMHGMLGVVGALWDRTDHVGQSSTHDGSLPDQELRQRHPTLHVHASSRGWGPGFGGTTA